MKLNLMKRFFDTVGPESESSIANEIAHRWLGADSVVRCMRASANFVFHAQASQASYFLRFNHEHEREVASINAELDCLRHLLRRGVHAATPVLSTSGRYIESVVTNLGVFHAVLFEALPGEHWKFDSLDERRFELWGKALGEIHAASQGLSSDRRPSWSDHVAFAERLIPASETAATGELRAVKEILTSLSPSLDGFGLIHFDFELDNLTWHQDKAGVLDFDDCAFYWYEADVAFALRDLFDDRIDRVDFACNRLGAFLRGYRSQVHLSDAAVRRIPLFLRMHNLFAFARLVRALEGAPEEEPTWMADLRNRLTNLLIDYREAFRRYPVTEFAD